MKKNKQWVFMTGTDFSKKIDGFNQAFNCNIGIFEIVSDSQVTINAIGNYITDVFNEFSYCSNHQIIIHCYEFMNNNTSDILFTESNHKFEMLYPCYNLGGLRSSIFGIISFFDKKYPAHAASLSIGNYGVLLIGGHGAGKTTGFMALLNEFSETSSYLTDDWCSCDLIDNKLVMTTPTTGLHVVDDQPIINLLANMANPAKLPLPLGDGKIFIPHSLLSQRHTSSIKSIDLVIIINTCPTNFAGHMEHVDIREVAETIIETATHYPYSCDRQKQDHTDFWIRALSKTDCYIFYNKNHLNTFVSTKTFIEKIRNNMIF